MYSKKHRLQVIEYSIILFIWVLLFAVPILFGQFPDTISWHHIFKIWEEYAYLFIFFLFNRFVLLPYLFYRQKRMAYFVSLAVVVLLFVGGIYSQSNQRKPQPARQHMPHHMPLDMGFDDPLPPPPPVQNPIPAYANLLILSILLLGFDTGLNITIKWVLSEQERFQLEKENTEHKLAFLHNQISPHFFMNTLNNIHALVDIDTEETKAAIIKLSHMMGYLLYETTDEKIPLKKEMAFIESYVELMRLRFTDDIDIELNIPEVLPSVQIPPLLTISFIENAFKHGISYQHPSFVHINFKINEKQLLFELKNSNHAKPEKVENSGIGLKNSRTRLDLIYNSAYDLAITRLPENVFAVQLNIPL